MFVGCMKYTDPCPGVLTKEKPNDLTILAFIRHTSSDPRSPPPSPPLPPPLCTKDCSVAVPWTYRSGSPPLVLQTSPPPHHQWMRHRLIRTETPDKTVLH